MKIHDVFSKTQETTSDNCGIMNLLHKFYNQVIINEGLMLDLYPDGHK